MYKNEGLLLYVIAVLYFVLLRFLWSKRSNIFYERFLIYTFSPYPFTEVATTSVQIGKKKIGRKKMLTLEQLQFFLNFCMNCIDKEKKNIVPFHQCQLSVLCVN